MLVKTVINFINFYTMFFANFSFTNMFPIFDLTSYSEHSEITHSVVTFFVNLSMLLLALFFSPLQCFMTKLIISFLTFYSFIQFIFTQIIILFKNFYLSHFVFFNLFISKVFCFTPIIYFF